MMRLQKHDSLSRRERYLSSVPSGALLIVACFHAYFALTSNLSPWKGGGFGMFATADLPAARFVRVTLENDTDHGPSRLPVQLPQDLQQIARLAGAARTMPTHSATRRLAGRLAELDWRIFFPEGDGGAAGAAASLERWARARAKPVGTRGTLSKNGERLPFKRVRVQVRRLRLDVRSSSLSYDVLADEVQAP